VKTSDKKPSKYLAPSRGDDLSGNRLRLLIGVVGLAFPILLWLLNGWRLEEGQPRWAILSSVSAYYYTGAVSAFTGMLVALAFFLFTYKGFSNESHLKDLIAAKIACFAALGVAFFPTGVPEGFQAFSWWTPPIGVIHFVSAGVLFASFVFFSLFLFRQSGVKRGKPLSRGKKLRNGFYIFCGVAMLGCIVWIIIAEVRKSPIFWPEALALEFFAASWLVKGRADVTVVAAGKESGRRVKRSFTALGKRTTARKLAS